MPGSQLPVCCRSWVFVLGCILLGVAAMSQLGEQGSSAGQADPSKKVGYCRPPEEHRFKEGVSGNPKGRPRKKPTVAGSLSSEWNNLIKKELNAPIKVIRDGEAQTTTVFQAILQLHRNAVLKKDLQSADRLMGRALKAQQAEQKERTRQFEKLVKYKLYWAKQIHRSRVEGYEPLIPVPNPERHGNRQQETRGYHQRPSRRCGKG